MQMERNEGSSVGLISFHTDIRFFSKFIHSKMLSFFVVNSRLCTKWQKSFCIYSMLSFYVRFCLLSGISVFPSRIVSLHCGKLPLQVDFNYLLEFTLLSSCSYKEIQGVVPECFSLRKVQFKLQYCKYKPGKRTIEQLSYVL